MISSTNAFGGMSAADLMKLFGTNSAVSSPSNATASSTTLSASVGLSVSSANDSVKTIQTILAEAEINKAPTATSGGSTVNASVAAAYVAHTGGASASTSASGSDTLAAVGALTDQVDADIESLSVKGWSSRTSTASSLVLATTHGVSAVAAGNSSGDTGYQEQSALGEYEGNLLDVQNAEAQFAAAAEETAGSASTSSETNGSAPNSTYLRLSIQTWAVGTALNDVVKAAEAKAQQLVTAFKDQKLSSDGSNINGFSYSEGSDSQYVITGIEVPSNVVFGMGSKSDVQFMSGPDGTPYFNSLTDQSSEIGGGGGSGTFAFAIPLGSS